MTQRLIHPEALALTARWIAASRARESLRPEPLFTDPLAAGLAGPEGFALLAELAPRRGGGADRLENPYHVIRTRFFDEALLAALSDGSDSTGPIRQVLMPAAGLDTRAYRLDWPPGCRLYELDQPDVLSYKQGILDASGLQPACARIGLGLDLRQPFGPTLIAAGFEPEQPACLLIEGLFYYLEPDQALTLLKRCAELAAPGSVLLADLIGTAVFRLDWTRPVLEQMAALGAPWRFGHDEPEAWFAACGWEARVCLPGSPEAHYGRWPHPPQARDTPGLPQTFLVRAIRR